MIKAEFGIIQDFDKDKSYSTYEPHKYNCVAIADDRYINDWWQELLKIDTYNMSISQSQKALSRWGTTIIPPESLPALLAIVEKDRRYRWDRRLRVLAKLLRRAIAEGKYVIHYGV